jgi:hypothetical protein
MPSDVLCIIPTCMFLSCPLQKLSTIPSNARCKGLIKHSTEHLVLPVLMGSLAVGAAAALYLVLGVASSRGSQKSILR